MTSPAPGARRRAQTLPPGTIAEVARGVLAVLALAALVLGMPVALWALGRSLRLAEGFDLSRLSSALTRPDDGNLFLLALLLIAWGAWAVFGLSVVVEVVALARGMPTPRLPLFKVPQQGAAVLVATAALLVTSAGTPSQTLTARPVATASVRDLTHGSGPHAAVSPTTQPLPTIAAAEDTQVNPIYPTVTVRRHDTLWSLAEKHLGSGKRFHEIVELNKGRPQPGGRTLTGAGWVYPGWVLRLSADAHFPPDSLASNQPAMGQSEETYVVERGDSLWEIADDELGDGKRYGEIYQLNEGRPQPDGMRLSDPDEIWPGWQLRLPAEQAPAEPEQPAVPPPEDPGASIPPPDVSVRATSPAMPGSTETGAPQSPASGAAGTPGMAHTDEQGSAVAPVLLLGLGTIVLTGLVGEVTRRRRLQQRARKTGHRIAMPSASSRVAERQAGMLSDPVTVETLRSALRLLAMSCRDADRPLPDVVLIRLTPTAIELVLLADDVNPLSPFQAMDARTWCLGAMPPTSPDDDPMDPFPALVTIGVANDALVLLNLEAVGSLTLVGPPDGKEAVLRALALELAVGPLGEVGTLTFVDCFADLARMVGPGRARFLADTSSASREADMRSIATSQVLEGSGAAGIREARARGVASDAWTPEILIAGEELTNAPAAWSGVAAVMARRAPVEDMGWTFQVRTDGSARLDPLGVQVSPQTLTQQDYDHLVSLLATACTPTKPEETDLSRAEQPSRPSLDEERNAALAALPEATEDVKFTADAGAAPPRVLLLGTVYVDGADDAAAPRRRRRATELVAYLALHPGATAAQIDEALWPGRRVSKNTRNPFVSRVRQWLGRTAEGELFLPMVADGSEYRLWPEVTCDWHDFLCLARRGLSKGPDGVEDLASALELVRGRPFLGIDPATYTWAEVDIQEMISAIVDVAHVLSATRCDAGDYRGGEEAAARGLLVDTCSELLYQDAIRAAAARDDRQEVERLADRLRHEIALLDPDDGVEEETSDLLLAIKSL